MAVVEVPAGVDVGRQDVALLRFPAIYFLGAECAGLSSVGARRSNGAARQMRRLAAFSRRRIAGPFSRRIIEQLSAEATPIFSPARRLARPPRAERAIRPLRATAMNNQAGQSPVILEGFMAQK